MSFSYCADESLGIGEPLAGSAISAIDRFLVLEHAAPWGPKGVEDSDLPQPVVAWLMALTARHRRLRVQLVRSPGSVESERRQLFFADTTPEALRLRALTVDSTEALLALDLDPWLCGEQEAPGAIVDAPLYLVCVHGKRDRCCARLGQPLFRELRALGGERVLTTTHLGGHRFAATLLVLPAGISYGRVAPEEAEALFAASERGELHDLARVRGRTAYTSEVQAAEVAVRMRLSERGGDALRFVAMETIDGTFHVRFAATADGREHDVWLRAETLPPAPTSCGAAPKAGQCIVPLSRRPSVST